MKYQRIADLREDADLKQEVIAKLLGTSQTQYSRLARYYRVSVDYLLGLTNNKKGTWVK